MEKQILEDSKSYLQQRIKKTVLHRGRNHGLVNIRVEPFFSFCFEKFFLQRAECIESWRILHRKNKQLGKKSTTVTIPDFYTNLDEILGDWRKIVVFIPCRVSATGFVDDGYYALNQSEQMVISYNYAKLSLSIRYKITRFNSFDVFQG